MFNLKYKNIFANHTIHQTFPADSTMQKESALNFLS